MLWGKYKMKVQTDQKWMIGQGFVPPSKKAISKETAPTKR
jgi:hypothetical protein